MFLVILQSMRQEQEPYPYRFVRCDGSITVLEQVSTGDHIAYDFSDYDPGKGPPRMLTVHDRNGELRWDEKYKRDAHFEDLHRQELELRRQRLELRRQRADLRRRGI